MAGIGITISCANTSLIGFNREWGDRVAELNRRAYAWYADEGLWTQAVQHALSRPKILTARSSSSGNARCRLLPKGICLRFLLGSANYRRQ